MKYIIVLLISFIFTNISFAQNAPLEGTEEGVKLEKELIEKQNGTITIIGNATNKSVKPLYIVNGIVVDNEIFRDLDPDKIATINVYKDEKAIAEYGDSGKNGVIVIALKDKYKKTFDKMMEEKKG